MSSIRAILRNSLTCSAVVYYLVFPVDLSAQDSPVNVLQVARRAWSQYLDEVVQKPWKIEGSFRQTNLLDDTIVFDNRFELILCGENARSKSGKLVKAANNRYQFNARSKDGSIWQRGEVFTPMLAKSESPLKIRISADDPVAIGKRNIFSSDAHASAIRALARGLLISDNWFPAMTESQHFSVKGVEQITDGGRDLTRIFFAYRPAIWEENIPRDGWVDLDPGRSWLIARAHTKAEWGPDGKQATGTIDITNFYKGDADGPPLLTRQDMAVHAIEGGNTVGNLWTREYTFTTAHCNPDDFTLAAFGLSEPAVDVPQRSRLVSLLIIGNLLLVAVVIAFLCVIRIARRSHS